jgi:hypothetical protein
MPFIYLTLGQISNACHISARHITAPKGLKVVSSRNIFFSSKMEHLFGAEERVAKLQQG